MLAWHLTLPRDISCPVSLSRARTRRPSSATSVLVAAELRSVVAAAAAVQPMRRSTDRKNQKRNVVSPFLLFIGVSVPSLLCLGETFFGWKVFHFLLNNKRGGGVFSPLTRSVKIARHPSARLVQKKENRQDKKRKRVRLLSCPICAAPELSVESPCSRTFTAARYSEPATSFRPSCEKNGILRHFYIYIYHLFIYISH
jgi:hypothetical protein